VPIESGAGLADGSGLNDLAHRQPQAVDYKLRTG
jgi:hypothetical protein